ncbi:MAG: (2Fe-2S) ferredoxin domain-containing protein [Sedimentisphaeraceae bacterium JB056]
MPKPECHILICNSYRLNGQPQGVCNKKDAIELLQMTEEGVLERDISALVTSTGCLKACEEGPVMVIYPQGWWYAKVDEDRLEEILDALEEGEPVEDYLLYS